jgi:GTP pyrophosphokinase
MEQKSLAFEQLSDIFGFRVIVGGLDECYLALGLIHTGWSSVPGRFKDYISTPKQNDYRSIHTTVVGPGRQRVEIQVRTAAMDDVAEHGIAGHALYKDGRALDLDALAQESRAYAWLRRTIEQLAEGTSSEEFLEHTKLELFHDQVFCFTPKGRLIALPKGATAIDFAYAVHTDVGHSAVGVKINGRVAPLISELKNGDEVVITRAIGQVPPAAWEHIAVTGKARAAIRRATRGAVRAQYAGLGRQIVARAFERAGHAMSEDKVRTALPRLARSSLEDVFASVGRGEMYSGEIVKAVYPEFKDERKAGATADRDDPSWFGLDKAEGLRFKFPEAGMASIPIRGLSGDLPVRFAPNGGAVPGDRIVGILTPGQGITIYPIQSPALGAIDENDRWLDVRWDIDLARQELFPAQIEVTAINEPGCLAQITGVIAELGANIDDMRVSVRAPDVRKMIFDVEVWDLKQLNAIMSRLKAQPMVSGVERVNG